MCGFVRTPPYMLACCRDAAGACRTAAKVISDFDIISFRPRSLFGAEQTCISADLVCGLVQSIYCQALCFDRIRKVVQLGWRAAFVLKSPLSTQSWRWLVKPSSGNAWISLCFGQKRFYLEDMLICLQKKLRDSFPQVHLLQNFYSHSRL